ncbi:uncharacterized protein LOC118213376 [Anguilla anguilla]|uniref:uncharacterized protein LOC118213376 n=1 Tax=Anguilla anguilla TaxID=7936 RepID=UPI0015A7A6B5|nr:uncharacterized protein LOC118213376 [Anguilla anguilla]
MMKSKMRVFCWFLSLFCATRTEGFAVLGPAMPLVVQLGASVTLPCSVDTPLPLHELEVEWTRGDSGTLVHLFQEEESRPESQSPAYSGRADFFSEEISKGNFSLLLRNVTTEDKGLYKCVVHTEHESHETEVTIDIERLVVTGADVPAFAYAGEDVILNCSVDTHVPLNELEVEWIKTNGEILVLLFSEGEDRPESQQERFRGRAEFFSEEIPKGNFSLKLRDVKSEDRGEFMCKVHTDRDSVNATAWLQEQGFSTLHLCVLGLTIAAAAFAVTSCIPALWYINKERQEKIKKEKIKKESSPPSDPVANEDDAAGKNNRAVLLYCLQVSVPCILMSIAFAIWGYIESSVGEAYVCSTINLMRILVIFKVAPYVLPGTCYERLKSVALPLESFVITTGVNSAVLHNLLTYQAPDAAQKLFSGFMFAVVILFSLSAVFSGLKFSSGYSYEYLSYVFSLEVFFIIFTRSAYGFTAVFLLWFVMPCLKNLLENWESDWCSERYAYLGEGVRLVLHYILYRTCYLLFLDIFSEKDKEHPALMCFFVFLCILTAILTFDHRSNLPGVLHILVYVFGSTVLSVLNSVALATELFLKARKGERTVEDLRVIVFPLESFFLACWLGLQVYAYCTQNKKMKEQLELMFRSCKTQAQSSTSSQQNQE